jgi:hypothetical protein
MKTVFDPHRHAWTIAGLAVACGFVYLFWAVSKATGIKLSLH